MQRSGSWSVVSLGAAACQTAKVGQRCRSDALAQDASHVLKCVKGRFVRLISKADGIAFVRNVLAAKTTTTISLTLAPPSVAPPSSAAPPTSPSTTIPAPGPDAIQVTAGSSHTSALIEGGTDSCWGGNINGQLGDGTSESIRVTRVVVVGIVDARAVSAGAYHTCALLDGGTVKCWGAGGQLGGGSTTRMNTPAEVSGITGAFRVAAGPAHTCVILTGGTIKCWGINDQGQLGDRTTTNRLTPVSVAGISGATQVGGGVYHSCALVDGGIVKCWGDNFYGQLGDGSRTPRLAPVVVSGVVGAIQIAVSSYHSCALLAGGTINCWGYNENGGLGDGTTGNNRLTPVAVIGVDSAAPVAARANHM